ncbi:MAG: YgjP-like metallopeptidase domain-containing protein, partial [Alphaproteobacteria bacterium]|nr:YgjP-like metallopeptidase domain-containing protein [Alphaproteobacteria bacterium]
MKQLSEQPAHYITVGDKRLPLIAKKHPRAKSMVVRYDARKDCVKLTLPRYVSLKSGLEFAASKSGWIAAQMEKHPRTAFEDGVRISLFGEEMTLRHVGGRGLVRREGASLIIPGEKEFSARRVEDFIKRETKKILALRAGYYAAQLGVSFRSIALR